MGIRSFLKAFRVMSYVSDWAAKALEDDKVTAQEMMDLGMGLCEILGVKAEITVVDEEATE